MSNVFAAENTGSRVYKIGRAGLDTGSQDAGGVYTMRVKSEKLSPAGEGGLCYFRRVHVRIHHTGAFSGQLKVYVDGVQTQVRDASNDLVDQVFAFSEATPSNPPAETQIEMAIDARGTKIEVEMLVDSDDVSGVFLPESFWIGHRVLREGRQEPASAT